MRETEKMRFVNKKCWKTEIKWHQSIGSALTLQDGIGGWKNGHVHSCVVRVGQPDDTVGTVMCDAPVAI